MNRAAKDVSLGDIVYGLAGAGTIATGSHIVTSTEAGGSRIVLTTGLSSVKTFFSSYTRSGSPLAPNFCAGSVAGTLTVLANSSASPLANDVASFIAF